MKAWLKLAASGAVACAIAGSGALAQSAETFYAGKTISVIVPFSAGGYYDTGGRLLARHLGPHIPGKPNMVVQNQPAAGGIGLANRFAAGEGDGLQLGTLQRGLPQLALTGDPNIRFDPLKTQWIGSMSAYAEDAYVLAVNATHRVKTAKDLFNDGQVLRVGANRSGSTNLTVAIVLREVLGFKYEIVRGYPGAADINLAQQRDEVDSQYADVSFFRTNMRDAWENGKLNVIVQTGRRTRLPLIKDVPMASELTTDPDKRALLEFAEMPFYMALPVAAHANTPKDRADALRAAFMKMAQDKAFLDEAKKMNFVVDPISGDEVRAIVERAAKTPAKIIEQYKKLIEG